MTGLSAFGEASVLECILGGAFLSLHTGDPGNVGFNEISGGAYERQLATFANFGNNPTIAKNDEEIQFPVATTVWGIISHFGLWSDVSGGSLYISGAFSTPKNIIVGDIARFPVNSLQVSTN